MSSSPVPWLAVVACAVSTFLLGGLWYGPLLGKPWMRASGIAPEQAARGNMAMIFGLSFMLQLLAAFVLAMFIGADATLGFAVGAAASVGACWVAPALGVIYLFEQRPFTHWAINAGYHVAAFSIMGLILGLWP